jgi:DNA topoisomerase-1
VCKSGRLGLKLGRGGPFIGCSNYPSCSYTRPLTLTGEEDAAAAVAVPRELGIDPQTGMAVSLRKGPFGFYVQLGEAEGKEKPKRAALSKTISPAEITLEQALALLSLPRTVGNHPEDGQPILAGLGRFGPYVKHGSRYASLGPDDDVLSIGLNRAVTVLAEKPARRGAEPLRELGPHPEDKRPVVIYKGRFGPYLKHGKVNATLPKGTEPESVTMDEAVSLLAARAARGGKGRKAKAPKATANSESKTPKKAARKPKAKAEPKAQRAAAASGATRATKSRKPTEGPDE